MGRLNGLRPPALTKAQHDLYSDITQGPRGQGTQHFALLDEDGSLRGPFNAFLLSPSVGRALQQLGEAIRYRSSLTPRVREMAILTVATQWHSEFEWFAHERVGRAAGITDEELEALRTGSPLSLSDPYEACALSVTSELLLGELSDQIYENAVAQIGEVALFELSALVGYYSTVALQMRVFRVGV